jgi:hypothetical protein
MIQQIFLDNYIVFLGAFLAMISGLSVRISLSLARQKWASTYHHTMSYILLPLITLIITIVISGNIALSLGMIGALSIVRFRTPVKNPFELVVFFALITIGISMAVNVKYGLLLAITIDIVILVSYLVEYLGKIFGFRAYNLSFDEGNSNHIIEITTNSNIAMLEDSKLLLNFTGNKKNNTYYYRLASKSKVEIKNILAQIENNENVLDFEIRFS